MATANRRTPAAASRQGRRRRTRAAGRGDADGLASDTAVDGEYAAASAANVVETQEQAIISKGVVSLVGVDVAGDRFDVQKVVDAHDGEVVEEKNQTNEDGEMTRSRLVIRIPVADFDATMSELEKVAQLASSSRDSEDVTTEVIDTEVRIRAQSESLKRVELLLAQAQSIRDIVAIEAQLTRRQAELDSLKSRQAYLADQTSLSTITVFLEKKPEKTAAKKAEEDDSGFFAGLGDGWDGMKTFLVGLRHGDRDPAAVRGAAAGARRADLAGRSQHLPAPAPARGHRGRGSAARAESDRVGLHELGQPLRAGRGRWSG